MTSKFALVIANTEYHDESFSKLTAPGKDAETFAHVLRQPDLAAFDDVQVLLNEGNEKTRRAIARFFKGRKPDDLLLLYFSGHGVRNDQGRLFLAASDTEMSILEATGLPAEFVTASMNDSRSKRQVLILDCCNSGAFDKGAKSAGAMGMGQAFKAGFGRIVLTATDSVQFAWEGNKIIEDMQNSVFTHFLIEGLKGEADLDGDGKISVDELYEYAYDQVGKLTPKQTPGKWSYEQQGGFFLRENLPPRVDDSAKTRSSERELLEQGLSNWRKQKLLLGPDALKVIESQKANLIITPESAEILFYSALAHGQKHQSWDGYLPGDMKQNIVKNWSDRLTNSNPIEKNLARKILWGLYRDLPKNLKFQILAWKISQVSFYIGNNIFKILATLIILTISVFLAIITTVFVPPWSETKITSFEQQCVNGLKTINPVAAMDPNDISRVAVYDPATKKICQTWDTAWSWEPVQNANLSGYGLKDMAINDLLYVVTDQGITGMNKQGNWENLTLPKNEKPSVIAITPTNPKKIFVGMASSLIYVTGDAGLTWEAVPIHKFDDQIVAMSTNGTDLLVATRDSLQFYSIGDMEWQDFDLHITGDVEINDVEMIHESGDAAYVIVNRQPFLGNLHDQKGVGPVYDKNNPWPINITKLAVYGTAFFVGTNEGLYCSQSWNIFESEWWRWKIPYHPPCQ